MSDYTEVVISKLKNFLRNMRSSVKVASGFSNQVDQIDCQILGNDKTGMVSTIYDFMVHSSTVPLKIETKNKTLDEYLQKWQTQILNKNINIDTPIGLRALSAENFKERWRSSLLALKVRWEEQDFGGKNGKWIVPTKMWFLNGGAIAITNQTGALNTRDYYVKPKKGDPIPLKNTKHESVYIRRPFTLQHKNNVIPYFVQRGTVYNALMVNAISQKQQEVIEAVVPLILELQAGTEALIARGITPNEKQFKELKQKLVDAKNKYDQSHDFADLIATLRGDTHIDYLIPDLKKIFDDEIVKSSERRLLASLGMIELKGFSSNREEAILNPKVLVEEVMDAVADWADLLRNIMIEMLDRNISRHPSLANNEVRVIPAKIKAFITDDMRAMLRSLYDRGIISKQTAVEDIANVDFEGEVERRIKEDERGLQRYMKAPVIQNLERWEDPELQNDTNLEDQNKKPGTPEGDNFNQALLEGLKILKSEKEIPVAVYESIDDLPENIKSSLPVPAQMVWLKSFNTILKESGDEDKAKRETWAILKLKYKQIDDGTWIKKATVEDYKNKMSACTYKYFKELYANILEKTDSEENALETSLALIDKVATKNKDGILVKDKTVTKNQLEKLEDSEVIDAILNLELKEKKLKLLDKLLTQDD